MTRAGAAVEADGDGTAGRSQLSKVQEAHMDLWATLGVSPEAGFGAVLVGLAVAVVAAGRIFRRSRRQQRVWVDLNGHD